MQVQNRMEKCENIFALHNLFLAKVLTTNCVNNLAREEKVSHFFKNVHSKSLVYFFANAARVQGNQKKAWRKNVKEHAHTESTGGSR